MALPRKLKNFNVFHNFVTHIGQVEEIALPKLALKTEEYRGGGMPGPVDIDMGLQKLEIETTYGGIMYDVLLTFGVLDASGVILRFAGAYQHDDTGAVDAVEIYATGRHTEIDFGKAKAGDKNDFKVKSTLTKFALIVNFIPLIEIDMLNMIYQVGLKDRLTDQRNAITGLIL